MSSSSAGKFQDHYAILGIEPKSSSDVIQAAYSKFAQKYHPNNPDTADREKFDAVNHAYEVLSDPLLRGEFDKLKGVGEEARPKFSGIQFFEALGRESGLRSTLLCLLYDRRRTKPFTPSLSMRHIENMIAGTNEELAFALWYLKKRAFVLADDKSSLQITVEGMDFLEANRPLPEVVMSFIKPEATSESGDEAPAATPVQAVATAATAATGESMRNRLSHALARR